MKLHTLSALWGVKPISGLQSTLGVRHTARNVHVQRKKYDRATIPPRQLHYCLEPMQRKQLSAHKPETLSSALPGVLQTLASKQGCRVDAPDQGSQEGEWQGVAPASTGKLRLATGQRYTKPAPVVCAVPL